MAKSERIRWRTIAALIVIASASIPWAHGEDEYAAIDISLFEDSIGHWQKKEGRDRNDPRYAPHEIVKIGDNILLYQTIDGGWSKNIDWLAAIPYPEMRRLRAHVLDKSSLDNRNTYPQVDYLAKAYEQTGFMRFRLAAERGLDYILDTQHPNGGWRGADVDAITYNDSVMTGVMTLLHAIGQSAPQYAWLDPDRRARATHALDKAIAVTLACQIEVDGEKTGWCQQHDHDTLAPVKARSYELPALCSLETASIVRFLMELEEPTPEIVAAIDAGVAWLRESRINGVGLAHVPMEPVRFENHTATADVAVVEDADAPALWARYYEIDTNRPFFCNPDGTKVYTLAEVVLERRTGYAWYGVWPTELVVSEYDAWRTRLSRQTPG